MKYGLVVLPTIYWRPDGLGHFKVWREDWKESDAHTLADKETFKFVEQTFLSFGFKFRRFKN